MSPSYRPVFHFTPARGWMNDPNGLVWHNGLWHLCYQHAPAHVCWDPGMHWGHAVSRDLTHWEHWPIALYPDEMGAIFSGSTAALDQHEHRGELVTCFTHAGDRRQVQSLAFSRDEGRTWTKYEGNPVLTSDRIDFRDPKIFRYGSEWRMIVAAGFEAQIYASPNLTEWSLLSTFPSPVPNCAWECPDLIEINGQWILIASLMIPNSLPKEGNNSRYWLGAFNGTTFTPQSGPHGLSLGPDDYAAVSWSDAPNQRKVIIGWMSHWTYANQTPTREEGWRGMMTIPRVLSFKEGSLRQSPPEELLRSRGAGNSLDERGVANSSRAFEIELELDLEQIPKEISKWPRRNGLSARKRQRPMSKDLGLLPMTPQTGHCARAASQAVLKELLEKGLARRGVSGCVASAGQALQGLPCLRALPETPRRSHHFGNLFWHLL